MKFLPAVLAVSFAVSAAAADKLKVAMYCDYGARGGGMMGWVKILSNCPQVELGFLDANDIRAGRLTSDYDVFLLPGGATGQQNRALGEAGKEAIRKYVAEGGKYLGTCAGCGSAMNISIGIRLVDCGNYRNTDRGAAMLPVTITKKGAELMGIRPGTYSVQYTNGPIPVPKNTPNWDGKSVVLATYAGTLGRMKQLKMGDIYGQTAMLFATYGKGKVVISGPHPEKYDSTAFIALGQIHALTGVKCTYVAPKLGRRPIRVAFYGGAMTGKDSLYCLIDLYKSPELDVYPGADFGGAGSLDHADVLVLPDGSPLNYKRFDPEDRYVRRFQDRGGLVIAFGEGRRHLPKHGNSRSADSWRELKPAISAYFR